MPETDKESIFNAVAQGVAYDVLVDDGFITHTNNPPSTTDMTCAESFAFCVGSVTAGAIAGHASCGASWLLPPVAVLCHASVIVLQLVGNEECSSSYRSCKN